MAEKALEGVRFAKAAEVMTKDAVCIDGNETAADAIRLMREKGVSSWVMNRRGHEDAWGIMTREDGGIGRACSAIEKQIKLPFNG